MLNAIPRFVIFNWIPNFLSKIAEISIGWLERSKILISPNISFTHHNDIATFSEWIWVVGNRLQDNFWIIRRSLICRRSIVIPVGKILQTRYIFRYSFRFWPKSYTCSINPNVFSYAFPSLIQVSYSLIKLEECSIFYHPIKYL